MTAYYNEFDPKSAAWLRELIKAGHIAPGDVDERSIVDIRPSDLIGYTQCHFFAGIGVWSYALRRTGWPDDRPVWTGSCPCQPFSAAGKGAGFTDERHLWPHFHWLIENCRPPVVFGEQVASKDGLGWLDLVQADLEGSGYASGAVDTCAAGFGAPHIRQRLWWVAHADDKGSQGWRGVPKRAAECVVGAGSLADGVADTDGRNACAERQQHGGEQRFLAEDGSPLRKGCEGARSELGELANTDQQQWHWSGGAGSTRWREPANVRTTCGLVIADGGRTGAVTGSDREAGEEAVRGTRPDDGSAVPLRTSATGGMDNGVSDGRRTGGIGHNAQHDGQQLASNGSNDGPRPTNGLWSDADWLFCRDGKWRPVEPGTFPLAHGAAARVGRLRGYGNAIVAPAAQAFIEAYLATEIMAANDNNLSRPDASLLAS